MKLVRGLWAAVRERTDDDEFGAGYRAGRVVLDFLPMWALCTAMVAAGYALGRRDCRR